MTCVVTGAHTGQTVAQVELRKGTTRLSCDCVSPLLFAMLANFSVGGGAAAAAPVAAARAAVSPVAAADAVVGALIMAGGVDILPWFLTVSRLGGGRK